MTLENKKNDSSKLPPGQRPIKNLLRWGIDHPGISRSNPKIDLKTYILEIGGEVENPVKLGWEQVLKLPKVESVSNFHCVEGWSVMDCRWEGIQFKRIVELVKPKENVTSVTFYCADGYTTSLTLDELSGDNDLLAYGLGGKPLEEGIGFPLRLVVPNKYGYKSALWVVKLKFTVEKELGFWEKRGYSDAADIWSDDRYSR
jgi:DMSO/TMAO reductase YedYZ molybdopterin-dependent catalytic subunit